MNSNSPESAVFSTRVAGAARARRFFQELEGALRSLDGDDLSAWGRRAALRLPHLAGRRLGGLAGLGALVLRLGAREAAGLLGALRDGRFAGHAAGRLESAAGFGAAAASRAGQMAGRIADGLVRDPRRTLPPLVAGLIGFNAGSGGLDGDGGIPDLDLVAGIGYHRSPLTHSILAGIVAEGVLLALADLAARVHHRLPAPHDPLWDDLARAGRPLADAAASGLSAGIAWHLLVDAFIEPAPYQGLPVPLPEAAHQGIMAANAAAEATHAAKRRRLRPATVLPSGEA